MYSLGDGHLLPVGGGGEGELFWESLEHFQNNLQLILATLDTIGYLESIFLNIVNMAILPSPPSPSPWKQCCCVFKRKPDPWAFVERNF